MNDKRHPALQSQWTMSRLWERPSIKGDPQNCPAFKADCLSCGKTGHHASVLPAAAETTSVKFLSMP